MVTCVSGARRPGNAARPACAQSTRSQLHPRYGSPCIIANTASTNRHRLPRLSWGQTVAANSATSCITCSASSGDTFTSTVEVLPRERLTIRRPNSCAVSRCAAASSAENSATSRPISPASGPGVSRRAAATIPGSNTATVSGFSPVVSRPIARTRGRSNSPDSNAARTRGSRNRRSIPSEACDSATVFEQPIRTANSATAPLPQSTMSPDPKRTSRSIHDSQNRPAANTFRAANRFSTRQDLPTSSRAATSASNDATSASTPDLTPPPVSNIHSILRRGSDMNQDLREVQPSTQSSTIHRSS
jgi:hypothetical protein